MLHIVNPKRYCLTSESVNKTSYWVRRYACYLPAINQTQNERFPQEQYVPKDILKLHLLLYLTDVHNNTFEEFMNIHGISL